MMCSTTNSAADASAKAEADGTRVGRGMVINNTPAVQDFQRTHMLAPAVKQLGSGVSKGVQKKPRVGETAC